MPWFVGVRTEKDRQIWFVFVCIHMCACMSTHILITRSNHHEDCDLLTAPFRTLDHGGDRDQKMEERLEALSSGL